MPSNNSNNNGNGNGNRNKKKKDGKKTKSSRNNSNSPPLPDVDSERLAAQLQEDYRSEFLSRQAQKGHLARATAPTLKDVDVTLRHSISSDTAPSSSNSDSDSVMARRLEQQWQDEEFARRIANNEFDESAPSPTNRHQEHQDNALARRIANGDVTAQLTATPAASDTVDDDQDRKLAQELQDEELARRYANAEQAPTRNTPVVPGRDVTLLTDEQIARQYESREQEQASRMQARQMVHEDEEERRRRKRRNTSLFLLFLLAAGAVVASLFIFGVIDRGDVNNLSSRWLNDDIVDIDPFARDDDSIPSFNASNPSDQATYYRWNNNGQGLDIEIVSALSEDWQDIFEIAVIEWDSGTPDSLNLRTSRVAYDKDCRAEDDIIKVCNGDYGATRWRGLNEVLLDRRRNRILQSAAKMNEHYMSRATRDQRQYTMCHEIGHGFGLPHWDIDFYNRDLGNCMDYTDTPEDNKTPDQSTFDFLVGLYGTLPGDGNRFLRRGDGGDGGGAVSRSSSSSRSRSNSDTAGDAAGADTAGDTGADTGRVLSERVLGEYEKAHNEMGNLEASPLWRMVESSAFGESHEAELGDDIVLQVHMLLA